MKNESEPQVEIQRGAFNVVVAPCETAVRFLRYWLLDERLLCLYVCGNYSLLLSRLGLRDAEFEVRRAFTTSQLLSIAEESHHTFVFIEHDPTLYSESEGSAEYVSLALRELSRESTVVLYSAAFDDHLKRVAERADRIFCIERVQPTRSFASPCRRFGGVHYGKRTGGQSTLEGF